MFMGYIYITCHDCGQEVKHHSKDVQRWPTRICPGCGNKMQVMTTQEPEILASQQGT